MPLPSAASETASNDPDASRSDERTLRMSAAAGLTLCVAAFWMLQHRYAGLVGDATLYALGVLARLHPESLGHDIFLASGSQDHYTLFSPAVALLTQLVGMTKAAAWITFVAQIAYFASGSWLARRLMPPAYALLAAALLVTLRDGYGAEHIFYASETLMTARMPADALVVTAIAAALARRYVICGVCLIAASLLHPLMTAAGVVLLLMLWVGVRRPWQTFMLAAFTLCVLWLAAWMMPHGPMSQADGLWFGILRSRLSYAFPLGWSSADWGHALVPLATLAVGSLAADCDRVRVLCRAALATGVCGLCLSVVGSDLLHIVLIMRAQPWRWLWIANVLAVILIPVIARDCLRAGPASRGAVLLLAAAWLGIDIPSVAGLAALAVAVVALKRHIVTRDRHHLALYAAALLLVLSTVQFAASLSGDLRGAAALLPAAHSQHIVGTLHTSELDAWTKGGILPAAIFASLWSLAVRSRSFAGAVPGLVVGVALCTAFAPLAWRTWTEPTPWEQWHDRFTAWRHEIPPDAQVLVPDVPTIPWFVLGRPSYWSLRQMAGMVFSRPIAMKLLEREKRVSLYLSPRKPLHDLASLCTTNPALAYLITPTDMGATRFAPVDIGPPGIPGSRMRLYRCADYRN